MTNKEMTMPHHAEHDLYDVEHACEGHTFVRTGLTRKEADRARKELEADETVTDVRVVPAPR